VEERVQRARRHRVGGKTEKTRRLARANERQLHIEGRKTEREMYKYNIKYRDHDIEHQKIVRDVKVVQSSFDKV
jgi:hypothetical protein